MHCIHLLISYFRPLIRTDYLLDEVVLQCWLFWSLSFQASLHVIFSRGNQPLNACTRSPSQSGLQAYCQWSCDMHVQRTYGVVRANETYCTPPDWICWLGWRLGRYHGPRRIHDIRTLADNYDVVCVDWPVVSQCYMIPFSSFIMLTASAFRAIGTDTCPSSIAGRIPPCGWWGTPSWKQSPALREVQIHLINIMLFVPLTILGTCDWSGKVVTTYSTLAAEDFSGFKQDTLQHIVWHRIVLDESHNIKVSRIIVHPEGIRHVGNSCVLQCSICYGWALNQKGWNEQGHQSVQHRNFCVWFP